MLEMHDKNAGRVAISIFIHEFHLEEDKGRQLDKVRRQMRGDHLSFDLNFTHILSLGYNLHDLIPRLEKIANQKPIL